MNENINLCEILKGHEGETFYSPIYGEITLCKILPGIDYPIKLFTNKPENHCSFTSEGKYNISYVDSECMLFPSKDQRDWNKWDKENNHRIPKTWNELIYSEYYTWNGVIGYFSTKKEPIYKSMFALFKIQQLIEVGYGGNVTNDKWNELFELNYFYYITYNRITERFVPLICSSSQYNTIMFHSKELANEFLSYPENIQLLQDYFQIN